MNGFNLPSQFTEINQDNFELKIQRSRKKTILFCMALWSGPSKIMAGCMEKLSLRFGKNLRFCFIDCEQEKSLIEKLEVTILPTILFYKKGRLYKVIHGYLDDEIFEKEIKLFL